MIRIKRKQGSLIHVTEIEENYQFGYTYLIKRFSDKRIKKPRRNPRNVYLIKK